MNCCGIPVVQCLVCGQWIAYDEALKREERADRAVFCSEECVAASAGESAGEAPSTVPVRDKKPGT